MDSMTCIRVNIAPETKEGLPKWEVPLLEEYDFFSLAHPNASKSF